MKNRKLKFYLPLLLILSLASCSSQNKGNMHSKTKDTTTGDNTYVISAPVVVKQYVNRKGKITEREDLYIQRSIKDYYIKFCESKVTREDIETQLANIKSEIKVLSLEIEYRDGSWDVCDIDELVQSRQGEYVIIHKIL